MTGKGVCRRGCAGVYIQQFADLRQLHLTRRRLDFHHPMGHGNVRLQCGCALNSAYMMGEFQHAASQQWLKV